MQAILDALGAASYAAHSICLTNDPVLIWLYAVHNLMIWASYAIIAVLNFLTKGRLAGPGYIGFSAFIAWCGATHLTGTATLFWGVYRLDVVVVVATAWISASTAAYMIREWLKWRSARRISPLTPL